MLAKTNRSADLSSTESDDPVFGPTRNPWERDINLAKAFVE